MSFEKYRTIWKDGAEGTTLRAGGAGAQFAFDCDLAPDKRFRLFVTGETGLFYQWKDEPDYPKQYESIADALDPDHAFRAQYCLNLSDSAPRGYVRKLYKKIMWPPVLSYLRMNPVPDNWRFGLWARAKGLRLEEGGYLRMRLEVYRAREGVNRHRTDLAPDETYTIDIPAGECEWTEYSRALTLTGEIAHLGVWIEATGYSGEVYLENPFLTASSGENLLPCFAQSTHDREKFDWTAQYLSRKEWPEFRVELNGRTVFEGEVFERCHRYSEWCVDLPREALLPRNELTVSLISSCHDPLPYTIYEAGLITQPDAPVSLIAVSGTGTEGGRAYLLLRTRQANTTVRFEYPEGRLSGPGALTFEEAGLHGVALRCGPACGHARFALAAGDCRAEGEVPRIVRREEDGVVTGTGDMIYVAQELNTVEEYLCWYLSNGVGNLLTIRPTYRWSGSRLLNPEAWRLLVRVLTEMGVKYAHMIDGRELPGIGTNPDGRMLAGPCFLGRQHHEWDGAKLYWGVRRLATPTEEQYADMLQRAWAEDPEHVKSRFSGRNFWYYGDELYKERDPYIPRDTRLAEEAVIAQFSALRGDATRHTGPAVAFKYLLKAGFDWVGAETMYSSMEPLMAFLRGACLWKGIKSMGVHHAVQWSSSPQDAPEHVRRYRLALYVSYMQGATEINTEEGLWHLEEYYSHFHRFSECCRAHLAQQQDFFRYVSTHSRTGEFFAPMALLHGRHDGWTGFGNRQPWGWAGEKNSDAENSWGLMRAIYPLSKPGDTLYLHGCDTDHPVGYQTGTPLGNVDVLPVECGPEVLGRYPALAFMGYNCAEAQDMERLADWVRGGGTLLLTRAHLTDTTRFADICAGRLHYAPTPLSFCGGEPVFEEKTVRGVPISVCTNADAPDDVLCACDDGTPLLCRYRLGEGDVLLFNVSAYPAHPAIRSLYESHLQGMLSLLAQGQSVWAECGDDVQFTAWDQPDGSRHINLLAVDWYRDPAALRSAALRVGGCRHPVTLPFGTLIKAVAMGDRAAWPHDESGEVLSLTDRGAMVQGAGRVRFTLTKGAQRRETEVDFTEKAVQEIAF